MEVLFVNESKAQGLDGYIEFFGLLKLVDLERALKAHEGTAEYDAVFRYYFGCIGLLDSPSLREPLALLRQALATFSVPAGRRRRAAESEPAMSPGADHAPELMQIQDRLENFETRFTYGLEQLGISATEVPKKQHFVWLGGGLGDIQRDYINIWKQILANEGYELKLWYDSDALLAHETNRILVEAAKADGMICGGDALTQGDQLADLYEARALALKSQMFAHIKKAQQNGQSADDARMDLLVRGYGQDKVALEALKDRNLRSITGLADNRLVLRDINRETAALPLMDIYEREVALRTNLAAASDIVRFQALDSEGGGYSDVDFLPPLAKKLGDIETSTLGADARHGALQLILDHNPQWMPGRQVQRSKYQSYFESIPEEHREALERFANSKPSLTEVFVVPADRGVHPDGLRAARVQGTLANAFLLAHPGSAMVKSIMQRFRFNYDVFDAVALEVLKKGTALHDRSKVSEIANEVLEQRIGRFDELPAEEAFRAASLAGAMADYFSDGIRPEAGASIYMTGPAAMREGMTTYEKAHFTPKGAEAWRELATLTEGFNALTEEENDHSWQESALDINEWLKTEQARWRDGELKVRYNGDMAQLLKGQTIDFDEGWPVIEGRHVLSTDILQRLADDLGEPFLNAMGQSLDGPVIFEKALPLNFDDRQTIIAQPPASLPPESFSGPSTLNLSLDEVLGRLADGTFHVAQLSPLQRLLLGALLGATTLDKPGFDALSSDLENLANRVRELGVSSRYAAIERELYRRQAPSFLAGLASSFESPPAHGETALTLRKDALAQPLTLRQWGKAAARIEHLAKLEYRDRIFEQMDIVVDSFGSATARLAPQDLLLQGPGDMVAGRCYPLVLVMAASIAQDSAAVDTLRERFYLGVLEPRESDSRAFLQALEELRGTDVNAIGSTLARSGLDQVVAILKEKTTTSTLMLNSDNHAMLVAKTISGERSGYHFYDPNFGVFECEDPQVFRQALERFFLHHKMAEHYAAYGETNHPTFDLIEVDGGRVSELSLSSSGHVANLLQPGALSGKPLRPGRQRLASARGQSLVNNPRLGSSLLALDSHWWGQQIGQAINRLQETNQLAPEWVPLFETLEITPTGEYQLSLINLKKPENLLRVSTDDPRFLRIKNYLSETFSTLATKPPGLINELDPTEAGSVHTLNAGFTIQALLNSLRAQEGGDRPLTMAVRLHAYVNYAQLLHGNLVDLFGVIKLARQALAEVKVIARTSASVVGEALGHAANEGVGAVLGLANVGFDIYQLANAQSDVEKARFGTQLAFDSASMAVTGAGIGAGLLGAGSVAAVLGGGGVLLGGLAIGVAALAQGFATIAEEAKQVGRFFDELERAHRGGGYRLDATSDSWIPEPAMVFKTVDLRAARLTFDSPMLFPLRDHFGVPDVDPDDTRATNIRQALGLPGTARFAPTTSQVIVLPCTPHTFYGYEYKALPFATFRHDTGFDTARRLEKKDRNGNWQFLFTFYSFPSEYICYRLYPAYRPTQINIVLDSVERFLVVPVLPKAWHHTITYKIEGGGAPCSLVLNPGVNVALEAPSLKTMNWSLLATWANPSDVRLTAAGELVIGTTTVTFTGRGIHTVVLKLANNELFRVDRGKSQLLLIEQDAPSGMSEQTLLEHLKSLAQAHRLVLPYTPVHRFVIPFEKPTEPRYTTAYYDAGEDRFLYIRDPDVWFADQAQLGAVIDGYAYFYHPSNYVIWQVDANTGWIHKVYRLLVQVTQTSVIARCEALTGGGMQVVQSLSRDDGTSDELTYLIHEGGVFLCSITRGLEPGLDVVFSARSGTLADWKKVLGNYYTPPENTGTESSDIVDWQPAALVSICWKLDAKWRDMAWVRSSDRLIIRPVPRKNHGRAWPDSIKNMSELLLIAPQGSEGDVFVVYDKNYNRLHRLRKSIGTAGVQLSTQWLEVDGLTDIVAVQGSYLARTDGNLFFNVTAEGDVQLGGLTDLWFKGREHWWTALTTVAVQHPVDNFALLGLTNFSGDARLCAWYVDNRVLLSDLGHGKEVRLLSMTPDRQAAWLFDVSSGELYRQAFIDPDRLSVVFERGTQLLQADALPAPVRDWAPWRFADIAVQGAGLRATTSEGVVMELHDQAPVLITGVESHWVLAHTDGLRESLKALVHGHGHSAFLQVFEPENLQWYVVASERLIRVAKLEAPESFTLLGTQKQTSVLLHDDNDGFLHAYPRTGNIGPLNFVQRTAEVMAIEGQMKLGDLMPMIPDGVSTLILRMGQGAMTCQLSEAAWLRLESVIVDCRHSLAGAPSIPGKLIWALETPEKLLLSIVQNHLIIIDPDTGHSLIFRDVYSADVTLRGEVFLAIKGYRSFAISTLVSVLIDKKSVTGTATLKELLPARSVELAEG
ncbi:TcdA/TcdB pore-forming domain-containing protein [Pseudomonas sp. 6D_7.1_Bac1]|uniref:TcdA/TcdB pore-forming domain-containing protein n=1 Tax=Pseudomonas sp. 6D_7.1_Bac1 TaxID=2971615 RepID=UPI0021C5E812|nr:TcdA/TcdB pore-forming domain-containing protein [Pseudomonas sp. 6D_7.1_Bac1]MCU1751485.1 YopT-type cysteine protease domain-containing protein [Pseudomonas sp. 6D_7.1_Bac1]